MFAVVVVVVVAKPCSLCFMTIILSILVVTFVVL